MSFIDTDDEINYTEEDIIKLCKDYKDYLDIDDIILRREKKERKKFYQSSNINNIITDMKIGKKVIEKYDLAVKTETPIELIYENNEGNFFSIRDILKNNSNILEALRVLREDYNISLDDFVFAYYFSNISKNKKFLIEQLNKLKKITNQEYVTDEWNEKRNRFNIVFKDRMEITEKKFKKIKKFYKEINDYKFSNTPEELNSNLILEKTKVEIMVKIDNYPMDVDSGAIIFDEIRLNKNFPYLQYNSFDKKYYKIYDKDININSIITEKDLAFSNLEEEELEKENCIYILNKLELINKTFYILLIFDLENGKLIFEYPSNTSFKIYDDIKILIPNIIFKDEKTISIKGSFEMKIDNFKDLNLYYLTLFDEKISNFLYVNENKRPRSLMKNVKYYYKTYEEKYLESDYFITFHLEQLYINKYKVVFRSKIINKENNISEFALVFSKLIDYYQNYNFSESDLPIITNPYTGPQGDGLGDNLTSEDINEKEITIRGNKLTNLRSRAPELFPPSSYGRACGCPEQPIIIDEEDIEDWKKYNKGEKAISVFPPPDSVDRMSKHHIFVCPTDNSIMNYIINPDKESPFPILPCCSKQKKSNYYENYDEIKKDPEKFFNIKEEQKINVTKNILSTVKPLTTGQLGYIPEQLSQFLNNTFANKDNKFVRYGVIKNSKSCFMHCCLLAAEHLKDILQYVQNPRYLTNCKILLKYREKYLNQDISNRDIMVNRLKEYIIEGKGIKINKELVLQELYDYDNDYINYTLDNEIFESKFFYKLMEYLFFINIFVFVYEDKMINLEKPRHLYYHQREIRDELPSLLIFKHTESKPPVYEIIRVNDSYLIKDKTFLENIKEYINENGYYIAKMLEGNYNITKNFYNNINWNYIFKDYEIIGQFINSSGRAYALNIQYSKIKSDIMTIFITDSFPLDVPKSQKVYKINKRLAKKLFKANPEIGSQGYWYSINKYPKSIFVPLEDIKESEENICYPYLITDKKSTYQLKFKKLNNIKRNANIISQIILWIWNISVEKDLDKWFDNYVSEGDKVNINAINNNRLLINYRFPLNINNTEEAIEYYSDYIPSIFGKNQIFLYEELRENIYKYIKNYISKTQGYEKIPNKALVGIFNNEIDFTKKPNNKIIIGEKSFDEWSNFVENLNRNSINIDDTYIDQKRGFLFKNKNGNIFIIQNNINKSLIVSLLLCKIWNKLKINLGYYTTTVNIWKCLANIEGLLEALDLDQGKIIDLAKSYSTYYTSEIETFEEAINYLTKENIEYELREEDYNYITFNYEEYINKENFKASDPYNLFSYENGAFASMLNIK